jgi:hypothetical protein
MEAESSLPWSQEPTTCAYHKLDKFRRYMDSSRPSHLNYFSVLYVLMQRVSAQTEEAIIRLIKHQIKITI